MALLDQDHRIVVVGAGQAGFELCAKLRIQGVTGLITLIGEEEHLPYQRPPLTKAYLLREMTLDRLYFRPPAFFQDRAITLKLGRSCTSIDRKNQALSLSDGTTVQYDTLVLATGATPVRLPTAIGGSLKRVHYVRTLRDADAMAEDFKPGYNVLIVGGGYIGLEAAAVAAKIGMQVTLVEASERILGRVAASETSAFFRTLHRDHGVDIREGITLKRLLGTGGKLTGAELSDGTSLNVDVAVVGIGIKPNQALAASAGLDIDNGIQVDAQLRTSDPAIFAIGDCASFPHGDTRIRLESVGNAIGHAQVVAQTIAGEPRSYAATPWFWSEQYDVRLQIAGLSTGYEQIVTRGEYGGPVSHWYYNGDQLLAVDAMNDPRAYMVAKRLIDNKRSANPEVVADQRTDLKELL